MSNDNLEEHSSVLKLGNLNRIIAKYTIRQAIERIFLVNLGRKKLLNDTLRGKERQLLEANADVENNIEKLRQNLIDFGKEIEAKGTFENLQKFIMQKTRDETSENIFLRNYAIKKSYAKYLEHKVKALDEVQAPAEATEVAFEAVDEESLSSVKQHEIENRYNLGWENSRLDQVRYGFDNEMNQTSNEFDKYKTMLATEEDAAKNLIECYRAKINFLEDNLEYWTGEYERQMENITTDIHLTQDWIGELEKKISGYEITSKEYKDDLESFLKKRKLKRCARIIQRWWRQSKEEKERKRSPRRRRSPKGKIKSTKTPQNLDVPVSSNLAITDATVVPKEKEKSKARRAKKRRKSV